MVWASRSYLVFICVQAWKTMLKFLIVQPILQPVRRWKIDVDEIYHAHIPQHIAEVTFLSCAYSSLQFDAGSSLHKHCSKILIYLWSLSHSIFLFSVLLWPQCSWKWICIHSMISCKRERMLFCCKATMLWLLSLLLLLTCGIKLTHLNLNGSDSVKTIRRWPIVSTWSLSGACLTKTFVKLKTFLASNRESILEWTFRKHRSIVVAVVRVLTENDIVNQLERTRRTSTCCPELLVWDGKGLVYALMKRNNGDFAIISFCLFIFMKPEKQILA